MSDDRDEYVKPEIMTVGKWDMPGFAKMVSHTTKQAQEIAVKVKEFERNLRMMRDDDLSSLIVERSVRDSFYGRFAHLETGAAEAMAEMEEPGLTLDDLAEMIALLEPRGPIPTEIWFVDCRDKCYQFLNMFPDHAETSVNKVHGVGYVGRTFYGLPVVEWYMDAFDPETETIAKADEALAAIEGYERVWPWFVVFPGVWVRYSDGSAKRLVEVGQR